MIKLDHVIKQYDSIKALDDVTYTFEDKKRYVIVGESGSGKSTLLKVISKLESIDQGKIEIDYQRLSFVFQNDMLLNHLTAYENIAYGINLKHISKEDLDIKVKKVAKDTNCLPFLSQKTATLSGGQKQRVSIARSLMKNPDVLLMDEPFNSLDIDTKKVLMENILKIQQERLFTLIYVTHDVFEAQYLQQECLHMKNGKVI